MVSGQPSAAWDLRPRFYRPQYEDAEESEIRLEFEGHGLQLAATDRNRSKWEWYFLMQRYGAPTRLLDWTGNPLAALYFAIISERKDVEKEDASVWAFDPWRWNRLHTDGLKGPALPGWEETEPYLPDLEDACNGLRVQKAWPIAIDTPSIDSRIASQTAYGTSLTTLGLTIGFFFPTFRDCGSTCRGSGRAFPSESGSADRVSRKCALQDRKLASLQFVASILSLPTTSPSPPR